MIYKLISTFVLFFSFSSMANQPLEPHAIVEMFYKKYLSTNPQTKKSAKLKFSLSFQKQLDENKKLCKKLATDSVCGFGADGDIYLDAQEIDPKLDYTSSQIKFSTSENNIVEVTLNVYPSMKENTEHYLRKIKYQMVKEDNKWVIDDIIYSQKSARKMIDEENHSLKSKK